MTATITLDFWIREILLANGVHQHAKISSKFVKRLQRYQDFSIFQDGGRPPSWICLGHIWTTNSESLGVSITLQNLVMIDAVVFISHLRIDVHDNNDNGWQRGPLWPHAMGPIMHRCTRNVTTTTTLTLLLFYCLPHLRSWAHVQYSLIVISKKFHRIGNKNENM